jgi:DNA polymerase-3 subunit gamma/tau
MAYTVLARKYRSRTFDEVIGQEPIATTLVNAIKTERIHHGYLFTGTRGVGKTSMARILAKALNCLAADQPTIKPCCKCDACIAIGEGQDIDVIEIDAASNTGVDNIRELRSNTAYRPARSRYKIYIIDEVHMLSTGAFNALLKTLEEPPEHIKFILATTEIQKVPATIQSRCQRFNFRNIGPDEIAKRLVEIAKEEGAKAEEAVVRRVARLANGSMRDALSILDQLLSVSPKKLTPEVLDEILPPAQDEQVFALLGHAAAGDVGVVLNDVEAILSAGRGLEVFCNDAIQLVRTLMHVRACGVDSSIVDVPAASRDEYVKLASQFELSHYVQMVAMLEELRRNVRFSGAGRALTDALMVRLAKMRDWASIEQLLGQLPAGSGSGAAPPQKKKSPPDVAARHTSADPGAVTAGRAKPLAESRPPPPARIPESQAQRPAAGYADVPETADNLYGESCEAPPVASRPRSTPGRMPVTAEQRDRILKDPLVQQALELFEGAIVNIEREVPAVAAEAEGTEEPTE